MKRNARARSDDTRFWTRRAAGALAVVALTVSSPVVGGDLGQSIDACVQVAMTTYDIPGLAVALIRGNELVWEQGYGVSNVLTRQPC